MKALVLGITGKVGQPLAKTLAAEGWEVLGAARCSNAATRAQIEASGVRVIPFDVTRDDARVLPDVDVVFLEIWDPSRPDLIWPINFHGVGRVVERYAGVADIVNGSTIGLYGSSAEPATEDTPPRPDNEYGRSRYAQEKLIDYFSVRGGRKAIHVRYAHANTPKAGAARRMAEAILAGRSLGLNPDARMQVIAIEDFVRVTKEAVKHMTCPPTAIHCCHPRVWTQRELAMELHRRLGRGTVVFDREQGGLETSVFADASRMVKLFGEPRVSLDVVLGRIVKDLV